MSYMDKLKPCPFSGRTGNIIEQTGVENAEFYKHTVIDLLDEVGKK